MIPTRLDWIAHEVGGHLRHPDTSAVVDRVSIDSRGVSPGTLFVALRGQHLDGHEFLADAFRNGATAAIVSSAMLSKLRVEAAWQLIIVLSPLHALQLLARWYRRNTIGKVLAITGSNGKTTVKDIIKRLLASRPIFSSPGSYNSQLGLPLAILSTDRREELAVLEIGVSELGDMATLEDIAAPDYGVLTNIGMAHLASFGSREAIAREKMALFSRISEDGWVVLPASEPTIQAPMQELHCRIYGVGSEQEVLTLEPKVLLEEDGQVLELSIRSAGRRDIRVNTRSPDMISNLHIAATTAYLLGASLDEIALAMDGYAPSPTRMELWTSPEGIRIINDAHSSDPISVRSALEAAAIGPQSSGRKIFAFGGMRGLGTQMETEHRQVGLLAGEYGFSHLFLVGNGGLQHTATGYRTLQPNGSVITIHSPQELRQQLLPLLRPGDTVLYKGPRNAGMVQAAHDLLGSVSQRSLWVDLAAITENLARFRRHCGGRAKILAMLKALAYGTDLVQLAYWISRLGIHKIGVSWAYEGIALRRIGVEQDIYVFLADETTDPYSLIHNRLTPVCYSAELVETFAAKLVGSGRTLDVHLKVDTGMHRLGVSPEEALQVARKIRDSGTMRLVGVCTHFASADDPEQDEFTRHQIAVFEQTLGAMRADGFEELEVHAANTAATVRFPEAHYNMVRIGLGLYGVYPSTAVQQMMELELAVAVTSRIVRIQQYASGESLGYNRSYTADHDLRAAVVPFGYDDGLPRGLSNVGHVLIEGQIAPIIGQISMDQMQVDITRVNGAHIGAEVLLYGSRGGHVLRPEEVAQNANTIPHELLIRLGRRVQRIYQEP